MIKAIYDNLETINHNFTIGINDNVTNLSLDYDKNYRKLSGEPYFYMRNIKITGNTFKDSKIGISSEGVDRLEITGNTFINVETPVLQSGNKNVLISGNAIRQEARGEASTAAPYAP